MLHHERAYLLPDHDGYVLVYAVELADPAQAAEAYARHRWLREAFAN